MAKKKKKASAPVRKKDIFNGNIHSPGDYILAFSILLGFFVFGISVLGFAGDLRELPAVFWLVLAVPFCVAMGICALALYVGRHAHELPVWLVYLCFRKHSVLCTPLTHDQWKKLRAERRKSKTKKT